MASRNVKKTLIVALSAVLVVAVASFVLLANVEGADADSSGSCGDGLTYTIVGTTLTIQKTGEGTGAMTDYDNNDDDTKAPWRNVSGVKTLVISDGVTHIGSYAFYYCSGYNSNLTIPGSVESIGEYAFGNCKALTGSLVIPDSVTAIGKSAFSGCSGFKGSLTLPNNLTVIPKNAFNGCSGLTGSLVIPNSVTTFGENAFNGCSGLTGSLVIPNSVITIGKNAFYGCSGFNGTLTLSNSISTFGSNAFQNCSGFKKLIVPSGVQAIGYYAFNGWTSVEVLVMGQNVTGINGGAFYGWSFYNTDGTDKITLGKNLGHTFAGTMKKMCIQPQHDVIYKTTGGTGPVPVQEPVAEGFDFTVASYSGTKYGFGFVGWNDGTDTYQPDSVYTMGDSDVIFTAVWATVWCDIHFDTNGGSKPVSDWKVAMGSVFTVPNYQGMKQGFVFVGWSDGFNTYVPGHKFTNVATNFHLKAVWIKAPHTAYYDLDGGSGYVPSETVKENVTIYLSSYSGTKSGYTFIGWEQGSDIYQPGDQFIMGDSDVVFTAVWQSNYPHTVSYDVNGGTGSVQGQSVKEGTEFILASYSGTRIGYTYEGWSDGSDTYQPGSAYIMGASDLMFKAVWKEIQSYTVSYDVSGGTGSVEIQTVYEDSIFTLAYYDGTKPGYRFAGWSDGSDIYQPGTSYVMGTSDISFTAEWIDKSNHIAVYELNGGTGNVPSQTMKEDAVFTVASYSGTKYGFNFAGWSDGKATFQPGSSYMMGSSDVVFTAVWTEKPSYKVSYDFNDGSGSVLSMSVKVDTVFALASYSSSKSGCSFAGWSDGSRTYQPDAQYTMGDRDIVFKAVWTAVGDHIVEYNLNGGIGNINIQYVSEGQTFAVSSEIPVKEGYMFDSWQYGGTTYVSGSEIAMGDSNIVLTAVWSSEQTVADAGTNVLVFVMVGLAVAIVVLSAAIAVLKRQ